MSRLSTASVLGLALAASAPAALAQTDDLIRFFRLTSATSYLELGYELELQERRFPGSSRASGEDEETFTVGLEAELAGSFLHPSWLPFTLGGTFRRRATDVDTRSGRFEGNREDDASEYRLRLGILPEHQWSGQLLASRFLQDIDSTFVPRRTLLRHDTRLSFARRSRVLPIRFEIGRHRAEGLEGDPRDETRERFLGHLDYLGRRARSRAEVEVLDVLEELSRQDYRLVRLSANHNWHPGSTRKLSLITSLYAFDRSGTSQLKNIQAAQSVDWRPREDLMLSGSVSRQDQEDRLGTLSTTRLLSDLEHTLWGSLLTRLAVQVQRVELPLEGSQDLDQLALDFDYTRHLEPGILTLRLGGRRRLDDDDLPAERAIVHEERVFDQGIPIILETPGVITSTIEVTGAGGEPFAEGFDYQVTPLGDLVEIRVLPGGSIFAGETLLISYAVDSGRRLEVRTATRRYGGGWRSTRGWWFRAFHSRQSQDLLAGIASGRIDQTADRQFLAGVDRPDWRLNGTYHDRESEILPYVLRQLGGSWKLPLRRRLELTLRGRFQRMTFPIRHEETRLELAGFDLRYRIGRLRIDGTVERWNEDVLGRKGRHFQTWLNARWRHRKIEILGRWRLRVQRIEQGGDDERNELRIVLRRLII